MNYRKDKHQNDLSILGFGCMRFARKAGGVDMEKTEEQILYAIQNGVNYFDTAYIYPGSESALGQILEKNKVRDKDSKFGNFFIDKKPRFIIINTIQS